MTFIIKIRNKYTKLILLIILGFVGGIALRIPKKYALCYVLKFNSAFGYILVLFRIFVEASF